MTREDALIRAAAIVSKMYDDPKLKANGYPVDGWRPLDPAVRHSQVLEFAEFLIAGEAGTGE